MFSYCSCILQLV